MRILVTGITGQVGWELLRSLQPQGEVVGLNSRQLDLSDPQAIRAAVREVAPGLIVNPAAYTAVDKAETEPELAMRINGIAPGVFAEEAQRSGAALIHYSTDYVFDGTKAGAYVETDAIGPQSVYGKSKLAGEEAIRAAGGDHLILRTSWVYGARGKNFVRTILRLAQQRELLRIVADQVGAPTSARLIADITAQIVGQIAAQRSSGRPRGDFRSGTYHLTGDGETSWNGFATAIVDEARAQLPNLPLKVERIEPIATSEYPLPAPRPANSRLDTSALRERFGLTLPPWQASLKLCIAEISENLGTQLQ